MFSEYLRQLPGGSRRYRQRTKTTPPMSKFITTTPFSLLTITTFTIIIIVTHLAILGHTEKIKNTGFHVGRSSSQNFGGRPIRLNIDNDDDVGPRIGGKSSSKPPRDMFASIEGSGSPNDNNPNEDDEDDGFSVDNGSGRGVNTDDEDSPFNRQPPSTTTTAKPSSTTVMIMTSTIASTTTSTTTTTTTTTPAPVTTSTSGDHVIRRPGMEDDEDLEGSGFSAPDNKPGFDDLEGSGDIERVPKPKKPKVPPPTDKDDGNDDDVVWISGPKRTTTSKPSISVHSTTVQPLTTAKKVDDIGDDLWSETDDDDDDEDDDDDKDYTGEDDDDDDDYYSKPDEKVVDSGIETVHSVEHGRPVDHNVHSVNENLPPKNDLDDDDDLNVDNSNPGVKPNLEDEQDINSIAGSEVSIMGRKQSTHASFFARPGILAAVIGGTVVGLLCAILLVMFIVYRMRKKDEGSYALEANAFRPKPKDYRFA